MENAVSRFLGLIMKNIVRWGCGVLALFVAVAVLLFRPAVTGMWRYLFSDWEAERYVGREVSLLIEVIEAEGGRVFPATANGLYYATGQRVRSGQRLIKFTQGDRYSWFGLGSAVNIGFVLLEGDTVVEIHRAIELDSL
jgi:hypothetical protein